MTPERLLGADFFHDESRPRMTLGEWEEHKKDLTKMARFHSKAVREMKAGKRPKKTAITFADLQADADGRRIPPGSMRK